MGRRGKKELILFILLTFNSLIFSQTIISGFVKEKNGNSIPSASIILKDSLGSSTIGYTFLDQNGNYKLTTNQYGHFKLSFSSLGYKTKIISITVLKNQSHLNLDIKLEEQPIDLKEVIIRAEKPISILKDTILFKTRFFTNGTEQTVEDL
ncbi:carboxypeptidase-like regulatory domain-containing protein [Winogradskyella wichelsiae]|uniref:carboxypeptidase-like regulatory domain-containing protein n=1 Tax=Winogradskyella wichelsiae TaxID=2697007 RepID=UPI003EF45ACB